MSALVGINTRPISHFSLRGAVLGAWVNNRETKLPESREVSEPETSLSLAAATLILFILFFMCLYMFSSMCKSKGQVHVHMCVR